MPIEVQARLLQRAVFFAGESVHCEVIVSYQNQSSRDLIGAENVSDVVNSGPMEQDNPSDSKDEQILAWASAQIYCQCHTNENKVTPLNNLKGQRNLPAEMATSFIATRGETGHCFLSTKQTILFCNQKFQKGQIKKFIYTEEIPVDAPPSYRGQAVRYSYKITVGIGSINAPTKLIRLPIRVLSTKDIRINKQNTFDGCTCPDPFLEDAKIENHSKVDIYLDRLTYLASQRNSNVYNISCNKGSAGKFSLSKACYRIGEDLQGSFDFTDSKVRCIKYKVALQSEEVIQEDFQQPGSKQKTPYTSYSKYEECCLNCRQTNFSLPIPITATPGFDSEIVSLQWRLHCEFTTSTTDDKIDTRHPDSNSLEGDKLNRQFTNHEVVPKKIQVETLTWDVPVRIVASNPVQISLMSFNSLSTSDIL